MARVDCDTEYRLHEAAAAGKGGICALPHLGNWDAAGRWMKAIGLPALAVAEELQPRRLYDLFVELRNSIGMDVVGLSDPNVGRKLAMALGENRMVALVADRDFTGRGVEVEMFGRRRSIPAGPALLSLTTGAPLIVTPTYTTPDGWRIEIREPLTIEPTGDRRADVTDAHAADGAHVRGGDRGRAVRLAHVPAGRGREDRVRLPVRLGRPGRRAGPRPRARRAHAPAWPRRRSCSRPSDASAAEPWVRAVGRPVDITYNRSNAPIDPRPWSVRRVRAELRAFRPDVVHVHEPFTPSTAMWATLAAEAPVVATFHTGRGAVAALRRGRAADQAHRPPDRRAHRGVARGRARRAPPGSAGRSRSCRTARTSGGSPMPSRRTWARARSCCSSAAWTSARASRSPSPRSGGWRRIARSSV